MDCKITFTKRSAASAFTLVELLLSTGLGLVVLLATCGLSFYSGRSFAAMSNYAELDHYSRKALDIMTKEIRQANALLTNSATRLDFQDSDGTTLSYYYSQDAKRLYRSRAGITTVLLEGCDQLSFAIYQRNPVGGTYDQYPTAVSSNCKIVQLNWVCSRNIFGATANTESVQSAKIVIRKQ
jgi:Tfp pilus assembly protein PilW